MLNSHAYKITWNWNKQLLGANIDVGGRGGAQKKKTGHTHTVQTSRWSRHHSNVLIILSREPWFFWGSDYRWKCLHNYSSNVKYWLVMLVKNACKAISNHSKSMLDHACVWTWACVWLLVAMNSHCQMLPSHIYHRSHQAHSTHSVNTQYTLSKHYSKHTVNSSEK